MLLNLVIPTGYKMMVQQCERPVHAITQPQYSYMLNVPASSLPSKKNPQLYVRYTNDIFIVWKYSPSDPSAFDSFKKALDNQYNITWITQDRTSKTNFLDLTIRLDRHTKMFITRIFQKKSKLFLYIPVYSAHPPGLIKGLVYGFLETYWRQNTYRLDYIKMVKLLFKRLLNYEYEDLIISPILNETAFKIEAKFLTK